MTDWLTKLESRGARVARLVALVGMFGLVALALMTILDVLMRWLFNNPIDGVADVGPLVAAFVVASTLPLAVAGRYNVAIGFVGSWLGPRSRAWLEAFAALVTTVFFILLAWQFIKYTINLDARGQTTWVLRWPVAPWWSLVAAFIVLSAAMQVIILFVQAARTRNAGERTPASRQSESPADGAS